MASNDPRYYIDPIIEALFRTQAGQLQARQLAEGERSNKVQEQQNQDRIKAEQDRIKQQADLQNRQFELEKADLEFRRKQAGFENLMRSIERGAKPRPGSRLNNTGDPRLGPASYIDPLTGQEYDQSLFVTPEQLAANEAQKIGLTTTAQMQARQPFETAQAQFESQLRSGELDKRQQFEAGQSQLDRESQERIAKMRDATDRYTSQLAARVRLSSGAGEYDDDVINSYIQDIYLTGNTKESQVPQKLRDNIRKVAPKGWTPITDKDQELINGIPLTQELVDKVKLLSTQGTGITGRFGAATGTDLFGLIGGASDPATTRREIDGLIGNLSRIFGGEKGVLTQKDIERMQKLVYSVTSSQKGNLKSAAELETFFKQKLGPILNKFNPDQLDAILSKRGIDPNLYQDTEILLDDGTRIPDTPENRKKYGL